MSELRTARDFVEMALSRFPELRPEFEDDEDLHHVQMGAFARLTMETKAAGDWEKYQACVELASELWANPDSYLLNALNVSYLEHVDFDGPNGRKAWELLPPPLKRGWKEMQEYLSDLARKGREMGLS